MKRLIKLSELDINNLEMEYRRMIEDNERSYFDGGKEENDKNFELKQHENNDAKTFVLNPQNVVDYENEQLDTNPRPGIPGWWASSMRWIGR